MRHALCPLPHAHQYSSVAEAKTDLIPSNIPAVLAEIGMLVGRIIVQSGSNAASLVESSFTQTFGTSIISNHNNLAGLQGGGPGEYYHMTSTDYIGTGTGISVVKTSPFISDHSYIIRCIDDD